MRTLKLLAIVLTLNLVSCTDAAQAKMGGYGDEFKIDMINCDGSTGKSWISTGKVLSEKDSDGYYFLDKETGKLIEVTGRLVITKL